MKPLPTYAIFGPGTKDFPGEFVCRRFDCIAGTVVPHLELTARGPDLESVRKELLRVGTFVSPPHMIPRFENDDPNIIEVWM